MPQTHTDMYFIYEKKEKKEKTHHNKLFKNHVPTSSLSYH